MEKREGERRLNRRSPAVSASAQPPRKYLSRHLSFLKEVVVAYKPELECL
jgi:hypothetical protein